MQTDVLASIAKIRVPVTIIRGHDDKRISEQEMLAAVERNSLVAYVPLPGAGYSFGAAGQREVLFEALVKAYRPPPLRGV